MVILILNFKFSQFFSYNEPLKILAVIVTIKTKHEEEKKRFEEIIKDLKHENKFLKNELIKFQELKI